MRFTRQEQFTRAGQEGVSLLEALVVLTILAAVAGIGVQAFNGVSDQAEESLARAEIRQVVNAMQRFRQDTGYWPKEGPFENSYDGDPNTVDLSTFDAHPANLRQLFEMSFAETGTVAPTTVTEILEHDEATDTGWNGPYLSELDALQVSVGSGLNTDGSSSPAAGAANFVRAVGDTFTTVPDGVYFQWENLDAEILLEPNLGRPYFYFIDEDADQSNGGVAGCTVPCLVSAGPDGVYEAGKSDGVPDQAPYFGDGDDIVVNIGALN